MTQLRVSQVAALLGVSDDTVRRWVADGRLEASVDRAGRQVLDGGDVARFMADARPSDDGASRPVVGHSARNRLPGLVTRVVRDGVMAQVDIQVGPHRVVSLMTREAADELGLEPGVVAIATVKATNVSVEVPAPSGGRR